MKAISLHVGLNHLSPSHYGSDQPLKNPVNDANAMQALAASQGFETAQLIDNQATVLNLARAINDTAEILNPGDIFLLTYAGHGSQMFDHVGDEPDSLDETWCLYDRMILDDELNALYAGFREGVRVVIVSDSCHSGTVARPFSYEPTGIGDTPPFYPEPFDEDPVKQLEDPFLYRSLDRTRARSAFLANQDRYLEAKALAGLGRTTAPVCSVLLLAACQDHQLSSDGDTNGYFTSWLLHFWNKGAFAGSYRDLFNRLDAAMPRQQKPNLYLGGRDTDAFANQRPFSI